MKKILTIIIIVAMLAIGVFALTKVGNKDNVQPITINTEKLEGCMEGITLNVATTGTFAPFTYYDENGKDVIGFDLDVIKELQKLLGFEIANNEIPAMNAATITASITEGKVDMGLAALCATDERKQVMNFSDTYNEANADIFVLKLILGHSSLEATQLYTHVSDKKLKELMQNFNILDKEGII